MSICKSCGGELFNASSKRCHHCGSYQNWVSRLHVSATTLAILTALISVSSLLFSQVLPQLMPQSTDATIFDIQNERLIIAFMNDTNKRAYIHDIKLVINNPEFNHSISLDIDNVKERVVLERSTSVLELGFSGVSSASLNELYDLNLYNMGSKENIVQLINLMLYPHRANKHISEGGYSLSPDGPSWENEIVVPIDCSIALNFGYEENDLQANGRKSLNINMTGLPSNISQLEFTTQLIELAYTSKAEPEDVLDIDGKGFEFVSQNLCTELIYTATKNKLLNLASFIDDK